MTYQEQLWISKIFYLIEQLEVNVYHQVVPMFKVNMIYPLLGVFQLYEFFLTRKEVAGYFILNDMFRYMDNNHHERYQCYIKELHDL